MSKEDQGEIRPEKAAKKRSPYLVMTLIIMIVGVVLFLLTPVFLRYLHFDSDIPGLLIFLIGFVMYIVGLIVRVIRKKA